MSESTSITVKRQIPAAAKEVFDVLSNPHRHTELDGSGFVRGLEHGDRLTEVGQKFVMNMSGDHMGGDYKTDNIVSAYDANHMIGWKTAPAGMEPPGWEWLWNLESEGSDSTMASLTYDWSKVTDKDLLDKIGFPLVKESQLDDSLDRLAQAATAG
ncbi:MAG: polyketide cyclase [Ilumatobacteraceae bacterium]